jgi:hypothetical protein
VRLAAYYYRGCAAGAMNESVAVGPRGVAQRLLHGCVHLVIGCARELYTRGTLMGWGPGTGCSSLPDIWCPWTVVSTGSGILQKNGYVVIARDSYNNMVIVRACRERMLCRVQAHCQYNTGSHPVLPRWDSTELLSHLAHRIPQRRESARRVSLLWPRLIATIPLISHVLPPSKSC